MTQPFQEGGAPTYGGYAQCVVVDENYVCKIPDGMDMAGAAPLLCATCRGNWESPNIDLNRDMGLTLHR